MISLLRKRMSKMTKHVETKKVEVPSVKVSLPVQSDEIALRAYQYWLQRGGLHGYDRDDWYKAEQELAARN